MDFGSVQEGRRIIKSRSDALAMQVRLVLSHPPNLAVQEEKAGAHCTAPHRGPAQHIKNHEI